MKTAIAKSISLTFFKSITDKQDNWLKQVPQMLIPDTRPSSPKQNFHLLNFTDTILKPYPQQPTILSPLNPLQNLIFQTIYYPIDHIKQQQQEISSCMSTKSETNPSEPNIEIKQIQLLQFQANSPIQDKLVRKRLQSINAQCMSIFDGHGGNTLSQYASKKVTQLIDSYLMSHFTSPQPTLQKQKSLDIIKDSIQWAYNKIQQSFCDLLQHQLKTGNKQIIKIGTCAITCVIWQSYIVIANCGDSQAIIVTQDQNGLCYFKANQQLNTSNLDQLNRIQKQFQGIDQHVLCKSKQNGKVYIKGILQPTRTLGDYYLKKEKYFNKVAKAAKTPFRGPYIKHTPEFKVIPIKSDFRHLILASDGLWDFATKKQILKVIEHQTSLSDQQSRGFTEEDLTKAYIEKPEPKQIKNLTESLRDYVLQKCAKKKNKTLQQLTQIPPGERRNYCDDISIITVSFGQNTFE